MLIFFGVAMGIGLGLATASAVRLWTDPTAVLAFAGALIGASLTALAAILVATHQDRTRRKDAEEGLNRRQLGARAILASDLSQVCEYAMESAATAMHGNQINERDEPHELVNCPELGPDILLRLQRLVELLDGDDANQVVDLMHCYQVQQARLSGLMESLNFPAQRRPAGLLLSRSSFYFTAPLTVELHLRAEAMFPFARQVVQSIAPPPFTTDAIQNTLRLLDINDWLPGPEINNIEVLLSNLSPLGRWRHG